MMEDFSAEFLFFFFVVFPSGKNSCARVRWGEITDVSHCHKVEYFVDRCIFFFSFFLSDFTGVESTSSYRQRWLLSQTKLTAYKKNENNYNNNFLAFFFSPVVIVVFL